MLNNRLTDFLDKNEQLKENQAAFRKDYSTADHISVLNSLIEIMKASKKKLFCAFIDFRMLSTQYGEAAFGESLFLTL